MKNNLVAHSFIIESTNERYNILGLVEVAADCNEITSNRVEGCVVLAMVQLLTIIATFFKCRPSTAKIYCDNDEALRYRTTKGMTYSILTKYDIDLKLKMASITSTILIKFKLYQVDGHADDKKDFEYDTAQQKTKRNIDMDKRAKAKKKKWRQSSTYLPIHSCSQRKK